MNLEDNNKYFKDSLQKSTFFSGKKNSLSIFSTCNMSFKCWIIHSLLLLCCGACQQTNVPASNKFLQLSIPREVNSLDPRYAIDCPSIFPIKMLFEGLMCIGLDGKVKHALAEKYEISKDRKTYTFHLRPSNWSNGDELTAFDFEYTWKKTIDPKLQTVGKHNFYVLKNAQAIVHGTLPVDALGVKAVDAKTLVVDLEHPAPYFLEVVATSSFFPINAKVDQENPDWATKSGKEFVCNGPFSLNIHKLDNEFIFVKNPSYWDASHIRLPGVKIFIIKDAMTQLSMFEKNEIDFIGKPLSRLPLDAISTLKKEGKIHYFPCAGLHWYFFNVESFPFNNKKIRQAFTYAVNRKDITDYVLQEGETPALGLLPPLLALQKEPYFKDNNSEVALKLFNEGLAELGITKKDLPKITLQCSSSFSVDHKIAVALQDQWQKVFDIHVALQQQEGKVYFSTLAAGNFQIGAISWVSWLRDPIYIMQTFRYRSDRVNSSRWENPQYQKLLEATEEEVDTSKRTQLFHEAEKILMDEFPVIPIYYMTVSYAQKKNLKDVYISELYDIDFRWSYFDDSES